MTVPSLLQRLLAAASDGDIEEVRHVLDDGAPINGLSGGRTALHAAVVADHEPLVDLLLERGADVRAINADEETPLGYTSGALYQKLAARWAELSGPDAAH